MNWSVMSYVFSVSSLSITSLSALIVSTFSQSFFNSTTTCLLGSIKFNYCLQRKNYIKLFFFKFYWVIKCFTITNVYKRGYRWATWDWMKTGCSSSNPLHWDTTIRLLPCALRTSSWWCHPRSSHFVLCSCTFPLLKAKFYNYRKLKKWMRH